jgi:hypothetical protein
MPNLNIGQLFNSILTAGRNAAGAGWTKIVSVATHEFQVIAHRIVQIGQALASGQSTKADAKDLMKLARNHVVATIATLTTLVLGTVQKIVNAALSAVSAAVNTAVGFTLL